MTEPNAKGAYPLLDRLRCWLRRPRAVCVGAWDDWACVACGEAVPRICTCGLKHRPGTCDGGR